MCGVAGFHDPEQPAERLLPTLQRMVASLRHRGPDGEGVHVEGPVALGHARLSIVDPEGGAQPMANEDATLWIVCSGEVFNYVELREQLLFRGHRFRTRSDTETLLHLYEEHGLSFLDPVNGDYALALWDGRRRRLVLARDRMGVRPLYYTTVGRTLVFASEIKAVLRFPGVTARLDPVALDQCFTFWAPLSPRTAFQGIRELQPGHLLLAGDGDPTPRPYWRLSFPDAEEVPPPTPLEECEAEEELFDLLLEATRLRLRADVPVGAYLSGGLDSCSVAALAQLTGASSLRTFSIAFEEAEYDERAFQREAVRALGTEHVSEVCSSAAVGARFPEVLRHAERPVLRTAPAPLYLLSDLVRRQGYKVVLTGEGADEVLGGYDLFKEAKVRRFWAREPGSERRPLLLRRLYPYLAGMERQPQAYLQSFYGLGLDRPEDPLFSHLPRWCLTARAKAFFSQDLMAATRGYDALEEVRASLPEGFGRWDPLSQAQYLEATLLLPGYILSAQGDAVSMAHGVEGRFPFLDRRVVELGTRLHPRLKLRGLREKHLLRRAMAPHLPAAIANRPKQPYRAPDVESLLSPAADYLEERLSPRALTEVGCFDAGAVRMLLKKCRSRGSANARDTMALVGILSVQLLHHLFVEGGGLPAREVTA